VRSDVVKAAELAALIQPLWIAFLVIALARNGLQLRWRRTAAGALIIAVVALTPVPLSWREADDCNDSYGAVALIEVPHMLAGLPTQPIAEYSGVTTLMACTVT
jgi:hypothetical protein